MGLGGWLYHGIDRKTVLGATGDPNVPGLGFRYETDDRWSIPNPTGLPGVFEAFCPPYYKNMREAIEALARRKFGEGGVYNKETPVMITCSQLKILTNAENPCSATGAGKLYFSFTINGGLVA